MVTQNNRITYGTYGIVGLGGNRPTGVDQSVGDIQDLGDFFGASDNAEGAEAGSKAGTVAEKADSLALKSLAVDVRDQAGKATPDAGAVHVAAHGSDLKGGVDALLEALFGQAHKGLLDDLVGQGLLVVHVADLRRDISKGRALGVSEVIMVKKAGVGLGDQLAGGGMESKIVEAVERGLGESAGGSTSVEVAVNTLVEGGLALAVGAVRGVEGLGVAV